MLVEVHIEAVKRWVERGIPGAADLLERIVAQRPNYPHVVTVEGDLWEEEWNPAEATFSWQAIADQIGPEAEVILAGAQTDLCVRKTKEELGRRGIKATIRPDLTIDLGNNT